MTCIGSGGVAVWGAHGGSQDCAVAELQVSEVSRKVAGIGGLVRIYVSDQCPGRIRTCAHGSGGQSCSPPTTCGNASSALRWGAYGCAPLTCSPVRATACGRVTMTGLNGRLLSDRLTVASVAGQDQGNADS